MQGKRLGGVSLAPGLAVGTACRVEPRVASFFRISISPDEVQAELQRLSLALQRSREQLQEVQKKFEAMVGKEYSFIIEAHLLILDDRQFMSEVQSKIENDLASPERAVKEATENWLAVYRSLKDPFFQERGYELSEVSDRVITNLLELDGPGRTAPAQDLILVAPEVTLSALAEYPLERVKGLVVSRGGRTSHVTIIARSYRIPVVTAVEGIDQIHTGDRLVVDGEQGIVQVNPPAEELQAFSVQMREQQQRSQTLVGDPSPSLTLDSRRIHLYGNTEIGDEVPAGLRLGAEGIGLFRSEYIYMKYRDRPVPEEEQLEIYSRLARTVQDRPAIVRTLDIGYEDHPYFSRLTGDREAVLGLRGIRLSLRYPDIFRAQLRAILKASRQGCLRILLPMVSSVDEVHQARHIITAIREELLSEGEAIPAPDIGVMLEVPAAILSLEHLAGQADFFAVGTNDLVQYTLATGRTNDQVANLYNPLHPAVLASLSKIAQISTLFGKLTFVCGEMAAQPLAAFVLIGLGFQHLSMNPFAIPEIKKVVRATSFRTAAEFAAELLRLGSLREVEDFLASAPRPWELTEDPGVAVGAAGAETGEEVIE